MKLRTTIITLSMTAALAATSQNLNKEITIEKEIVPEQRAATRLNVSHTTIKPEVRRRDLTFSDRDLAVAIVPSLTLLDPARTLPAVSPSPWRGYVAAAYFPSFNTAVSAGYNIVADSTTVLNAWTQYDGTSYTADDFRGVDSRVIDNTVNVGASLLHCFSPWQRLSLDAVLGYSAMRRPDSYLKSNSNTRFNLDGKWISGDETSGYHADLSFGLFGNSFDKPRNIGQFMPDAVREMNFALGFGLHYNSFSADIDASFLNYNRFNTMTVADDAMTVPATGKGKTNGVITLRPGYMIKSSIARADIGLRLQYTVNSGKNFHVAPDVKLSLTPSSKFAAYADFGGGEHQNSLFSLFDLSHFMVPYAAYGNSHIPFTADLGFVIGPFAGASFELFGGYAVANDWLMPVASNITCFTTVDMKGWHAGARARYDYRDIASLSISLEVAPQQHDRGYYLWRDRAKQVVGADLTVRPVKGLSIDAGWQLRGDRQISTWQPAVDGIGPKAELTDLEAVSNLKIGAAYQVTDAFTVFARGENLLGKKWFDISLTPMQGVTGLIGVEYKF